MICRRLKMVSNSIGHDFPLSQKKATTNEAFMNTRDLADLTFSLHSCLSLYAVFNVFQ